MERKADKDGCSLYDRPVSPCSGIYLHEPKLDVVILSFLTFENPIDVSEIKSAMAISLAKCPRLRSIPVTKHSGRLQWKELDNINISDHIVITPDNAAAAAAAADDDNERYINDYVAAMASWPSMRRDRPLWEVHVLPLRRRSLVLRVHHSLGDCVSLLALLLASCDPFDDGTPTTLYRVAQKGGLMRWMRDTWCMLRIVKQSVRQSMHRIDDVTVISGGLGVERMPRKLVTLTLSMDDMIIVKNKLGAKINDVFVGIITYGVAKYQNIKCTDVTTKDPIISVSNSFNIRGQGTQEILTSINEGEHVEWGNRVVGVFISVKLFRTISDPLQYVRDVQSRFNKIKKANEALNTYRLSILARGFKEKKLAAQGYRALSFTSLILSNIMGPTSPVSLQGNLVTEIRVTTSSLPCALEVHMISYNGKAFIQFLVASDIIPDPELLSSCVEEALLEMKMNK